MKILYLSQLAPAGHATRADGSWEGDAVQPLFEGLGCGIEVVDVSCQPLPAPGGYDGVVVGGSIGSVHDPEPWRGRLRNWLRRYGQVPLLGICGGHQLLAQALGSRVGPMAAPQVGVYPLELPGVEGFAGWAIQLHKEAVMEMPPGARLWAQDEFGIQALRYGGHRWTVQFHPEFDGPRARRSGWRISRKRPEEWDEGALALAVDGGRALLRAWLAGLGPACPMSVRTIPSMSRIGSGP